ncbi:C6 transcription factor (Fcr1), putative [Talaromyces stipitatus ATCC 10500]|uniref:C6 transcription factor (Fcr1), putative n=1 Tax=Talaromyces stipitatus (strain ATCC 10500 / CBS 375.48 / QM 6759 / NRRL 1006) TaxID=441959 RepID=B8MNJ2_TALSN|nr:C6 transcription factor (Fcr1), putative [Talaromyces stipitatus ATCC 10500]EED14081.1 C6 transcription factor (Fcr1), putative [Talaromyces stipitatus ATCC 10500]
MAARQSTPSSEHSAHSAHSDSNVRKRVCKACDRCRLKKSKCDGASPCGRCRADNAICVFGERKKAHDKVYPKGYVEMLEQQQIWLVNGLQEMYRRTQEGEGWIGEPLKTEPNGHPLTHDLLTRLGALDHSKGEHFEDNVESMQQKLWQQNAGLMQRQESSDGSSDIAHSPPATTLNINTHAAHQHQHRHMNSHHGRRHHPYSVSQYADALARHQLPPTPPGSYSPSSTQQMPSLPLIKSEPLMTTSSSFSTIPTPNSTISTNSSTTNTFLQQQNINPMALQPQTPWTTTSSTDLNFDDFDLSGNGGNQFSSLFDDISSSSSPMFGRSSQQQQQQQQQMPINCIPPSMLFEPGNDDFSQYFNTNTEISI